MEIDCKPIELLRVEIEHSILPELFYNDEMFETLELAKEYMLERKIIPFLYKTFCKDDGIEYSYRDEEFAVKYFEYQHMGGFQVDYPEIRTKNRKGLRSYLVFALMDDGIIDLKAYFLKEVDAGGITGLIYISRDKEAFLAEKITEGIDELGLLYDKFNLIIYNKFIEQLDNME